MKISGNFKAAPFDSSSPGGSARFAINHHWIPDKKQRRVSYGKWFRISCDGNHVYRTLQLVPNVSGTPREGQGTIVVDWGAWLKLSGFAEETPQSLNLEIRPASWWELPLATLSHPDPGYRLASAIALISLLVSFF